MVQFNDRFMRPGPKFLICRTETEFQDEDDVGILRTQCRWAHSLNSVERLLEVFPVIIFIQ